MTRWIARFAALGLGLALVLSTAFAEDPSAPPIGSLLVEFLDVGQGDAILIRSPEGKQALVDAGPSNQVVKLLERRGVDRLDLVAVSHHHADHYGGMAEVVRRFNPRVFLGENSAHTTPHYLRLLELIRDRGITSISPTSMPRHIELGSVMLTILPQAPEDAEDENNNSVGIRLQYGTFSVLLPGDAERAERSWWERHAADLCANATVLKLAHHGSRNGTDRAWLELVRPKLAVASLGASNDFGHPHSETLRVLAAMDIPLLRTDEVGTISVESDGTRWRVRTDRLDSERPDEARRRPGTSGHKREPKHGPAEVRVNLNTASEDALTRVPGIGPALARRIVAARPFRRVGDLQHVEGIGRKRFAEIEPFVTVK